MLATKQPIRVGVACLVRKTFDWQAAWAIFTEIQRDLGTIAQVQWQIIQEPIIEVEDARRAGKLLAQADLDGLVIISGTFHLGHLALELARAAVCPVLLWGLPELPYDGGKIRLNSVCGVNLNASNLYKGGVRTYHVNLGRAIDEAWLDALRVNRALAEARLAIAGAHAHGFFNLGYDQLNTWRQLGVLADHYELSEIFDQPVTDEDVARQKGKLVQAFKTSDVSPGQLDKTALLAAKLETFMETRGITALALRCWPEFARDFWIAPCAAMSLLQSQGRIIACEGDVEGALSMLAQRALGAVTPFLADLSQVDLSEDFALLWHCGVAPCNLWDGVSVCSLDSYFADGKGVTADFVLKSGAISLLRLDSVGQEIRLFLQVAQAVPMSKDLKGTYAKVKFPQGVRQVLDTVTANGIAHHISVAYGDFSAPLALLAKIKGWRVVKC
jgi:L-fucose isomerase-like protein